MLVFDGTLLIVLKLGVDPNQLALMGSNKR
jgi:hypothetical protein